MNTEEKELLLKEYGNRLMTGLQLKLTQHCIWRPNTNEKPIGKGSDASLTPSLLADIYEGTFDEISSFLPCLFPIECLTKPITIASVNDGEPFVPIEEIMREQYDGFEVKFEAPVPESYVKAWAEGEGDSETWLFYEEWYSFPYWIIEKLNEWHINYRLPAHLFVPVTETFNPYK